MAKYGAYSTGVPTTTGAGQGSAQLFTPTQHQRVDTSNLQSAIGGLGDTFAAQNAAKAKADAADKAAKAKRAAELQKRENGEFAVSQGAITQGAEILNDQYYSGQISYEDWTGGLETLASNSKALQDYDKGIIQPEQAKFNTDETAFQYVNGKWVSHAEGTDWLGQSPDEELSKLIKENPDLSTAVPYIQRKHRDGQQNFGVKDPNFSLAGAAFGDAAWTSFKQSADETTQATIQEMEGQNYDRETIIKRTASAGAYKDHLKQRSDIMGKWTKQQKFDEGLSNQYINYMLTTDNIPYVQQAYEEAIDNLILPEGKKEVTYKNVQTNNKTKSEESGFIALRTSNDEFDLTSTKKDKNQIELIAQLKKAGANSSQVKQIKIVPKGKGKQLDQIEFGGTKGTIKNLYVDIDGYGVATMNVEETLTKGTTTKKSPTESTRTGDNKKNIITKVVNIKPSDVKYLEDLYDIKILEKMPTWARGGYYQGREAEKNNTTVAPSEPKKEYIKGFSNSDVKAAAKASDMSVDEYIKMYNEQSK